MTHEPKEMTDAEVFRSVRFGNHLASKIATAAGKTGFRFPTATRELLLSRHGDQKAFGFAKRTFVGEVDDFTVRDHLTKLLKDRLKHIPVPIYV